MKKTIIALAFLIPAISFAQDCHNPAIPIENSNCTLKLKFLSNSNGVYNMLLTSLQNCDAFYQLRFNGKDSMVKVPAGVGMPLHLSGENLKVISARAITNCGECYSNCWVEVIPAFTLGLHFKSLTTQRIDKHTIKVSFTVDNSDGFDHFNVKLSNDAKTWVVKIPVPATKNTTNYSTIITF